MSKPILCDLFSGAGGAARGYQRADAMTFPLEGFDAIHASPPCQAYTSLKSMWNSRKHPDLVDAIRNRLFGNGVPYVIENVPGAPVRNYVTLCGSMFGLGVEDAELRRHRLFEIHPIFVLSPACAHGQARVIGVYGGHGRDRRRRFNTQGFSTQERREAMGIDWMTGDELSQAIPPAYTEFIGRQLLAYLEAS